jgi:tetratricopeptide (TPR) repeat protein
VGAIAPKLEQAEIERAKRKPTQNLDAYDYYLRGMAYFHRRTREAAHEALQLFYKAIELDPEFSSAYGMAAYCYVWRKSGRWMANEAAEQSEAARLARQAVDLGRQDAIALTTGGFTLAYVGGDLDDGASLTARALVLNPNFALAWSVSGRIRVWLGEPELAIEHLEHSMRLSPFDPLAPTAQNGIAWAHFCAGRYDEASVWAKKALQESPKYHSAMRVLAASSALAGRLEDAHKTMARLHEIDPTLRVSDLRNFPPLRRPGDFARYTEGLRKAGLPE